jgi:hypothetical protein
MRRITRCSAIRPFEDDRQQVLSDYQVDAPWNLTDPETAFVRGGMSNDFKSFQIAWLAKTQPALG